MLNPSLTCLLPAFASHLFFSFGVFFCIFAPERPSRFVIDVRVSASFCSCDHNNAVTMARTTSAASAACAAPTAATPAN